MSSTNLDTRAELSHIVHNESIKHTMTEQQIQNKKIKQLESDGWYVIKLIKTNKNGIPDLIAVKPNDVLFVEVKTNKGRLSKLQEFRIDELEKKGFKVLVLRK